MKNVMKEILVFLCIIIIPFLIYLKIGHALLIKTGTVIILYGYCLYLLIKNKKGKTIWETIGLCVLMLIAFLLVAFAQDWLTYLGYHLSSVV